MFSKPRSVATGQKHVEPRKPVISRRHSDPFCKHRALPKSLRSCGDCPIEYGADSIPVNRIRSGVEGLHFTPEEMGRRRSDTTVEADGNPRCGCFSFTNHGRATSREQQKSKKSFDLPSNFHISVARLTPRKMATEHSDRIAPSQAGASQPSS